MADQKPPISSYVEESKNDSHNEVAVKDNQEFKRTDPNDATIITKVKVVRIDTSATTEDLIAQSISLKKLQRNWDGQVVQRNLITLSFSLKELYKIDGSILLQQLQQRQLIHLRNQLQVWSKAKIPRDDAFEIQKEHFRQVKKRLSITVSDFAELLEDLNMCSKQLPGTGTGTCSHG
jgi:hypothetical protein